MSSICDDTICLVAPVVASLVSDFEMTCNCSRSPSAVASVVRGPCVLAGRRPFSSSGHPAPRNSLRPHFNSVTSLGLRTRFPCRSSLLDQAWGTHINAQAGLNWMSHCVSDSNDNVQLWLQELATNIFSTSIIPYSAFLYYLTKSRKTPPLALFGFYFLLVFVFATIPAGVVGALS